MSDTKSTNIAYQSGLPYQSARIHAAAIYCSDGRVGEHFDDFLQNGLSLPRYDRLALPGGPACLADHPQAHTQTRAAIEELQFLVEAHKLTRIVLIAHEGCAFYSTRLDLEPCYMERVQRADLVRAAVYVRRLTTIEAVDAYFARTAQSHIQFESVDV